MILTAPETLQPLLAREPEADFPQRQGAKTGLVGLVRAQAPMIGKQTCLKGFGKKFPLSSKKAFSITIFEPENKTGAGVSHQNFCKKLVSFRRLHSFQPLPIAPVGILFT
jgi:hypothetical protein